MMEVLNYLKINFKHDISFDWSKRKRYDFYIPYLDMIIEMHGMQHYQYTGRGRSLEEEQESDKFKENIAKEYINEYIIIDCRSSELTWLYNNIFDSINKYIELDGINYNEIYLKCQNSKCVESWELWNKYKNINKISEYMKIDKCTIRKWLKRGTHLNKCDYVPVIGRRRNE